MNTKQIERKAPLSEKDSVTTRMQNQIDFCAYAKDPGVYIRNAWTQNNKLNPRSTTMPIGTEVALEFGEQTLVCSLRKGSQAVLTIYPRMLPSDIALQEDISIDPWPQWRHIGNASDIFAFDKALAGMPWRWTFRKQADSVVIVPDAQLMTTALGMQINRPFASEALLELHPYLGSWIPGNTFLDRHPPIYPEHHTDAWGWLLPTAPWNFELEGYRFRNVWEYAVNPILRERKLPRESILERLVRATKHRLVLNDVWRERAQHHASVIWYLAGQTSKDERGHLYFLAFSKILKPKIEINL